MDLNTTIILLLATIGASLLAFSNEELMRKWILNPYMVQHRKQWWRMLTSGFIHADFAHLAFNMIAFYGFGMAVESYYLAVFGDHGLFYYLILYLGGILVANAPRWLSTRTIIIITLSVHPAPYPPSFLLLFSLTPGRKSISSVSLEYQELSLAHSTSLAKK